MRISFLRKKGRVVFGLSYTASIAGPDAASPVLDTSLMRRFFSRSVFLVPDSPVKVSAANDLPDALTRFTPSSFGLGRSSMEYSEGIVNAIMVPFPSSQMCTGAVIAIICSLSFLPKM